ncbi:MAG: hypothetical protein AAGA56_28270, partial [Myxococcota bacterium]
DCLVLDFVDLSDCELVSLPSLVGLPPRLDLEGATLEEAETAFELFGDDLPDFEVEPETITLDEIKERAQAFDPLALDVKPSVTAISPHRWESLGRRGLALHVFWTPKGARKGRLTQILILDRPASTRGKRWQVLVDDREMARFSRLEDAVEAVDYEIEQRDPHCRQSALPSARWRRTPAPEELCAALSARCGVTTHEEAGRLATYRRFGPQKRNLR